MAQINPRNIAQMIQDHFTTYEISTVSDADLDLFEKVLDLINASLNNLVEEEDTLDVVEGKYSL